MVPGSVRQRGSEVKRQPLVPGTQRRVIRAEGAEEASPGLKRRMFKAGRVLWEKAWDLAGV